MNSIRKFFRLKTPEKLMLLESIILLGFFRLILLIMPFKRIAPYLGQHMQESPMESRTEELTVIKRISWAVQATSRRTFWKSKCLVQALTAKFMLRRRHISSTLYLGVARDGNQSLIAHAWLRSGETTVTGAQARVDYSVVSVFADM